MSGRLEGLLTCESEGSPLSAPRRRVMAAQAQHVDRLVPNEFAHVLHDHDRVDAECQCECCPELLAPLVGQVVKGAEHLVEPAHPPPGAEVWVLAAVPSRRHRVLEEDLQRSSHVGLVGDHDRVERVEEHPQTLFDIVALEQVDGGDRGVDVRHLSEQRLLDREVAEPSRGRPERPRQLLPPSARWQARRPSRIPPDAHRNTATEPKRRNRLLHRSRRGKRVNGSSPFPALSRRRRLPGRAGRRPPAAGAHPPPARAGRSRRRAAGARLAPRARSARAASPCGRARRRPRRGGS